MLSFSRYPFGDALIFNLGSYIEGYPTIPSIDPLNTYRGYDLLQNELKFDAFCYGIWTTTARRDIVKIMLNLYYGMNIVFLIDERIPYSIILSESLSKYIQDRYGYISNRINTEEDILYAVDGDFSDEGLIAIENDLEWYRANFSWRDLPTDPPYD